MGEVDEKEHKGGKQPKPSEPRPVAKSFGPWWRCRSSITAQRRFLCAVSLGCRCNSTPAISIGLLSLHQPGQTQVLSDIYPLKYSLLLVLPTHKTWREKKKSIIYNVLGFPSRMESTLSNPINSCQTGGWIQCYL